MICKSGLRSLMAAALVWTGLAVSASAQITTGTLSGTVKDAQGGVIPGATVVLISESKQTKSAPVVTNETGDYTFPNVTPDTYTVEVTMEGFKTLRRKGVQVSGGGVCRHAAQSHSRANEVSRSRRTSGARGR